MTTVNDIKIVLGTWKKESSYMRDIISNERTLVLAPDDYVRKNELLIKTLGFALEEEGVPRILRKQILRKELRKLYISEKYKKRGAEGISAA